MSEYMNRGLIGQGFFHILVNIFFIIVILIAAFIVSAIVKRLVIKLLDIKSIKSVLNKLEGEEIDTKSDLSFVNLLGTIAYWLTFMLFLIPIFNILGIEYFSIGLSNFLYSFIEFIPMIIFAVVVLVAGIFLANLCKRITYVLLYKARLNDLIKKITFEENSKIVLDINKIGSWVVYVLVVLIFVAQAFAILRLSVLTDISAFLLGLVPPILASLIIFIGAYILGNFLSGVIRNVFNQTKESKVLGLIIKYFVWVMGIGMVLNQLGFDLMLLNVTYIVILITLGVALSISFGVAGIDVAKKILNKQYDKFDKE